MSAKATFITPVYNGKAFIAETVDSILAQTFGDFDYIVVDDGSTDGTAELLAERYGDAIVVIRQANAGEAAAVNRGVDAAQTDIVCVVNADDPVRPGLLQAAMRVLDSSPDIVGVYPDWEMIDAAGTVVKSVQTHDFDLCMHVEQHLCLPGPGGVFHKSALGDEPARDPRLRYTSDYDFWMRLALKGKVRRIPEVLATWRVHDAGASISARSAEMAENKINAVSWFFARADLPAELREHQKLALSVAHYSASLLAIHDAAVPGRRYLLKSLWLVPFWPGNFDPERHRAWGHILYVLALPLSRWLYLFAVRMGWITSRL